jgi:ATP-binding cassette subfamily F protein 3
LKKLHQYDIIQENHLSLFLKDIIMSILTLNNICLSYGITDILKNISFSVNEGNKVGIIGANGAGKTSLLNIIYGSAESSSGTVNIKKDTKIGFLRQHVDEEYENRTVLDVVQSSLREEYKTKAEGVLKSLGIPAELHNLKLSTLSGGQKTRVALAAVMMGDYDIIILDEPTNHLDVESLASLETMVKLSKKTFLIVSHDRYFLDKTTTHTVEIENCECAMYSGGYSVFAEKKKKLREDALKHYNLQQKEIARIEAFVANQRKWNRERNIIAAESRLKALDRMEKLSKPKNAPKAISFEFSASESGEDVLSVRNLSKGYNGTSLFNVSFEVKKGQRLFILGSNGCGKSTLLKILTGREIQNSGTFEYGYNQEIGYYDQEMQNLNEDNTVLEEIYNDCSDLGLTKIRSLLASFNFLGDDVFKSVSALSGGERARLSICKMVLQGKSLIILDEPTNHLDIPSREILENALSSYGGTIICVSHDRYFIKSLATHILEINKKDFSDTYKYFSESYERYLSLRQSFVDIESDNTKEKISNTSYAEAKKARNQKQRDEKRLKLLESLIPETEAKIKALEEKIATEYATDYIKLEEVSLEKDSLETYLMEILDEYYTLDESINQ